MSNSQEDLQKWRKIMDYVLNNETVFSIFGWEIDVSQFTIKLIVYASYQEYKMRSYKRKKDLEQGFVDVYNLERMQQILRQFKNFEKISRSKGVDPIDNWEERPMDIIEN